MKGRVSRSGLVVCLCAAAVALAGEGAAPAKPKFLVVVQDKAALNYENTQVGEVVEGTRLEVREAREGWAFVRAWFGRNWSEGWIRTALTVPDTMADVPLKVAPTRPRDVYEGKIEPGKQFLEVRVKLEPTEKSPSRVYFHFQEPQSADLYLRIGLRTQVVPYGFVRKVGGMTRPVFETKEKRQIILLKPGEPLIETYVFTVPVRSRGFTLVLKDVAVEVPTRR